MRKFLLLSMLAIVAPAQAQTVIPAPQNLCNSAPSIVQCLHPSARITGCEEHVSGANEERGMIYFRGGVTGRPYAMELLFSTRLATDGAHPMVMSKVTLLGDNAMLPPNGKCPLLNWN